MSTFTIWENHKAINNFREYLRIPSVHPNPSYDSCVLFLKKQGAELGLTAHVYELTKDNPLVIISWLGTDPSLPSILLNSHMDVVPVNQESWDHPPFAANMNAEGAIFARGAQDMKCVGIQYLEAVRELMKSDTMLKRTVHLLFSPDEECGGANGMVPFISTQHFKDLNVGFVLDEGMASPNDNYLCYNSEKTPWQIHVHCSGETGHGSSLVNDTAANKFRYVIDKFMDYRASQKSIMEKNQNLDIGQVTTVNLTKIYGGIQSNVIPEKLSAVFDIRLANQEDHKQFEKQIIQWLNEAGDGVSHEFERKTDWSPATTLDKTNKYWMAFKRAADDLFSTVSSNTSCKTNPLISSFCDWLKRVAASKSGRNQKEMKLEIVNIKISIATCTGATDSRYIRSLGIPVLGFSPINHTPVKAHDNNEFLHAHTFLEGINIYVKLIAAVANAV